MPGPVKGFQLAQEAGALGIGGEDHGMPLGRRVEVGGKARAAPPGQLAEPGRGDARRAQRLVRGLRGEDIGQAQARIVAAVEERFGQRRQVALEHHRAHRQLQFAAAADIGPQAGVQRVFALVGVMADEDQRQVVAGGDEAGIELDILHQRPARIFLGDRQGLDHFVVEHHLQVRLAGDQGRRIAVAQAQRRLRHQFIGAQAEVDHGPAFGGAQLEYVGVGQLAQRYLAHIDRQAGGVDRRQRRVGQCRRGHAVVGRLRRSRSRADVAHGRQQCGRQGKCHDLACQRQAVLAARAGWRMDARLRHRTGNVLHGCVLFLTGRGGRGSRLAIQFSAEVVFRARGIVEGRACSATRR